MLETTSLGIIIFTLISISCIILLRLSYVDLKIRILPNRLILCFAIAGIFFHFLTGFLFISPLNAILGAFIAFILLYALRAAANHIYQQDSFGMGDIKLISAGGIWLGIDYIMLALTIGASLCILHGLAVAFIKKQPLSSLQIPAGPGLALGIFIVQVWLVT